MITRVFGAAVRAVLVTVAVSIPALLLPNVSVAAQEITLIAAGLAAAFTLFEYASTHPGLIDFRFAPPYNRVRFVALLVQILALVFLCRADHGFAEFNGRIEAYAELAVALTAFPLSPVAIVVGQVPDTAGPGFTRFVEYLAATSFATSALLMLVFGAFLALIRWPVGRQDFNLWINLPTFAPGQAGDAERRLNRDGLFNILAGLLALYAIPVLFMGLVDLTSEDVQTNYQLMLWSATLWGFISGSLLIRGIALLKVWWLVRVARR